MKDLQMVRGLPVHCHTEKMIFLLLCMFQLESEVLVHLADWGSIANPASMGDILSTTWYVAPHSVSTAPVASLWSEDILVPTGGDRGDGDGAVPLDGEDIYIT